MDEISNVAARTGKKRFVFDSSVLTFAILTLISVILYLTAPPTYEWGVDCACCVLYLLSVVLFFVFSKKRNYFVFDTFFLLSYFFVFFVYSVFLYPINPKYFVVFAYDFNLDIITKCTCLALMGIEFYMLGSLICRNKKKKSTPDMSSSHTAYLPVNLIQLTTFVLFAVFIAAGGYSHFENEYNGNSSDESDNKIAAFSYILFTALFLTSVALEFNKLRLFNELKIEWKQVNKLFLFAALASSLLLIQAGTRTVPLQVILAISGVYTLYYYPVSLRMFIPIFILGSLSMFVISSTRSGGTLEIVGAFDMFMDLIINNRNTFTAVEYVNNNDISYGTTMLGYILKLVPFLQGMVTATFNLDADMLNSASLLTIDTLGDDSSWGLGTNIIADLYLAFGAMGVVVGMFFLGYLVCCTEVQARKGDIYYLVLYTILISLSVYMVRGEFFFGFNYVIWSFIIVNIFRHFTLKSARTP